MNHSWKRVAIKIPLSGRFIFKKEITSCLLTYFFKHTNACLHVRMHMHIRSHKGAHCAPRVEVITESGWGMYLVGTSQPSGPESDC